MITKEEYGKQIEYYENVLSFQPNNKEKEKILKEIELLKERILFLLHRER
jgi:hypothetical protein